MFKESDDQYFSQILDKQLKQPNLKKLEQNMDTIFYKSKTEPYLEEKMDKKNKKLQKDTNLTCPSFYHLEKGARKLQELFEEIIELTRVLSKPLSQPEEDDDTILQVTELTESLILPTIQYEETSKKCNEYFTKHSSKPKLKCRRPSSIMKRAPRDISISKKVRFTDDNSS